MSFEARFAPESDSYNEITTPSPKERDLLERERSYGSHYQGGVNEVIYVDLIDDGCAMFKPADGENQTKVFPELKAGTYYKRERAAYLVDRFLDLGLVPPTVIREMDGSVGSMQEFIPDAQTPRSMDADEWQSLDFESDAFQKMWLLDYIIHNADRNMGNYLIKDGGETVKAIDHGFCFANYPLFTIFDFSGYKLNDSLLDNFRSLANDTIRREILVDLLKELLSEEEVSACLARLDHLCEMAEAGNVDGSEFNYYGNARQEAAE